MPARSKRGEAPRSTDQALETPGLKTEDHITSHRIVYRTAPPVCLSWALVSFHLLRSCPFTIMAPLLSLSITSSFFSRSAPIFSRQAIDCSMKSLTLVPSRSSAQNAASKYLVARAMVDALSV